MAVKYNNMFNKLLSNKNILKAVTLVALFNFLGYLILGKIDEVLLFLVLGVVTSYFSKNMIVVLMVPLIFVNVYTLNNIQSNMCMLREGLTNNKKNGNNKEKNNNFKNKSELDTDNDNDTDNDTDNDNESNKSSQGLSMTSLYKNNKTSNKKNDDADYDESFEVSKSSKNNSYNIDYASTIEDAYSELNNILGSDGIKNLTNDTQNLIKQQTHLAEAMKGMGALVENMNTLMKSVEGLMNGFKSNPVNSKKNK